MIPLTLLHPYFTVPLRAGGRPGVQIFSQLPAALTSFL